MKDSGIPWIGEIPEHWEIAPFKWYLSICNGEDYKEVVADSGFPVMGSGGCFAFASEYLYDGEVVLLGRKGTIDRPQYYNGRFWTVDTMFYGVPRENSFCKYLYFLSQTIPFDYYKTSTSIPSMTARDLSNHLLAFPPLAEQERIARYLDEKCGEIDELIDVEQQMISDLEQYRQAVITEAVTHGLNPDAPTKDSGIDWIGYIPEHWKIVPLKFTGDFGNGLTYRPTDVVGEEGVLVLRSSNIKQDNIDLTDKLFVSDCPNYLMVRSGDIIICSRNGSASLVGKCAMVQENVNATFGAFMMRFRPYENSRFGFYLLKAALKEHKELFSTTTINQLTKGVIAKIQVPLSTPGEQLEIAEYLDAKYSEIDELIKVKQEKIETLKQYRQSLIFEAVTGKTTMQVAHKK